MVCDAVGPLSADRTRGYNPPKKTRWINTAIGAVEGWLCPDCIAKRKRLLPPKTRSQCIDGPRPCPRTLCRYHLVDDVSRKAPPGFRLTQTCALDVALDGPHTLRVIGEYLGMTREGTRERLINAIGKLRSIPGLGFDFEDDVDFDDREDDE